MKKCAIIANGYYHGAAMTDQIRSICRELEKLKVSVDIIYTDKLIVFLSEREVLSLTGDYDFILFLDKDPYISHMLEKAGYVLCNSAAAIELCDDKMKTLIALAESGLNVPPTVASPLNYVGSPDAFYEEVEFLGYPVVVKEVYGSMGKGVFIANDREELIALRSKLIKVPHLYQKFIGSGGRDIRVIVIGKKAIGAMERINTQDFRSNIELGGVGVNFVLTGEVKAVAEKAATVLNLDYCGVDILVENGKYYISEVNSNAFFKGFEAATKINVAKLYAEYLVTKNS